MPDRKISVVVPVYKTEEYLGRCVESLMGQTYREIEIVLVDDGSPDRCPAMCDAYARADSRIKTVHKENGGLVSAWQAGVKESSGDYLCFVDSDDWVDKEMLEEMAKFLSPGEKNAGEVICCNFVISRPDKETKHYHGLEPGIYEGGKLQGEVKDHLLGHENRKISMSRCMKLFSRSLIADNMKYSNPAVTMGEDVNITLPALLDSKRVVIMEGALFYHYYFNSESMVHKYDAGMYKGIKILYQTIQGIFQEKGRASGIRQADKEYIYLLLLAIKNEIRGGTEGYIDRVKKICREEDNRALVISLAIPVKDKTNRLLYFVLRHPAGPVIAGARLAFRLYDRILAFFARMNGDSCEKCF